jgi:GPI mannosyltransferase 3
MTQKQSHLLLIAVCALCVYLRVVALLDPIAIHPDEVYQYIEPAFLHLTGTGVNAWEFEVGVRSWVQPGINGALMVLGRALGVPLVWIPLLIRSAWALLSMTMVIACYRASSAIARTLVLAAQTPERPAASDISQVGAEAGLMGAALCGCFPWVVQLSVHTLSELPATIAIVTGLALCSELPFRAQGEARRLAMWAGGLVATGVLLRITCAPCVLVPALAILRSKHSKVVVPFAIGAALPTLLFGAVDWLTWGAPFISYIRYIRMNALEGVAASYGVEPAGYYIETLRGRLPLAFWPLVILCIVGIRGSWIQTLTAAVTLALLTAQPHKEERFIVAFWPLCLSAAAGTAGAIAALLPKAPWRHAARAAMVAATALILVEAHQHRAIEADFDMSDRMRAQTWLGQQGDVSGILIDNPICSGGRAWSGQPVPLMSFERNLLGNTLFSHAIVTISSSEETAARSAGFAEVHREGAIVVLARSYKKQSPDNKVAPRAPKHG